MRRCQNQRQPADASASDDRNNTMNFALTDEQQMIVDTVGTFVENELYPHEEEVERTGVVPKELGQEISQKCRDIGFYASNISTEFGGGGLNTLDFTLLERELVYSSAIFRKIR